MRSEDLSREFYRRLGAEGLEARTRPEWDAAIVASLAEMIPPGARVLDVGCGYGRITLPLARKDYRVEGLDHSPELLTTARDLGQAEGLNVSFTLGSMTSLPYEESSCDAVICLWSAFNELLEEYEQSTALSEMWRVLEPGGLVLVEGRPYTEASEQEVATGLRRGPGHRVEWDLVEGVLNPHYRHDETSLSRLCRELAIDDAEISTRPWGGRDRLILSIRKGQAAA